MCVSRAILLSMYFAFFITCTDADPKAKVAVIVQDYIIANYETYTNGKLTYRMMKQKVADELQIKYEDIKNNRYLESAVDGEVKLIQRACDGGKNAVSCVKDKAQKGGSSVTQGHVQESQNYEDVIFSVLVCAVFYQLFYRLCRYLCKKNLRQFGSWKREAQSKWLSYMLSTLNALICVGYAVYVIQVGWKTFKPHDHDIAGAVMLGYFVHDLIHLLVTQGKKVGMAEVFHHVIAIFLLSILFMYPNLGPYFPLYQLLELSTLFLNLSWHLIKLDKETTLLCKVSKIVFAATFFSTRNVFAPWLTLKFQADEEVWADAPTQRLVTVTAIWLVLLLNVYWMVKIMQQICAQKQSQKQSAGKKSR